MKYWDGQFDDARLALALGALGCHAQGALVVNYCAADQPDLYEDGKLSGAAVAKDTLRRGRPMR